jgi:hypothetical protein
VHISWPVSRRRTCTAFAFWWSFNMSMHAQFGWSKWWKIWREWATFGGAYILVNRHEQITGNNEVRVGTVLCWKLRSGSDEWLHSTGCLRKRRVQQATRVCIPHIYTSVHCRGCVHQLQAAPYLSGT